MKKLHFTKKQKVVASIISVIILVMAIAVGINIYHSYEKQKQIHNHEVKISKMHEQFSKAKERNEKLAFLKSFIKDYKQYKKENEIISVINSLYTKEFGEMKQFFIDEYNKTISDNTLQKVAEIKDKKKLTTTKTNLETALKTIESETGTVCTKREYDTYKKNIDKLLASYDTQIKAIEKKEAEEAAAKKAAEEAEAKRIAEEAAAQAAQEAQSSSSSDYSGNNYYNGGSSDSSSGNNYSGDNSSNSGSGSSSSGTEWHFYDKDGNDVTPPDYNPDDPVWY